MRMNELDDSDSIQDKKMNEQEIFKLLSDTFGSFDFSYYLFN